MQELGRRTRPNPYGMTGSFEALIPRELRLEVPERMTAAGEVFYPARRRCGARCRHRPGEGGGRSAGDPISCTPTPIRRTSCAPAAIARELWPNQYITVGHEILREVREFERGSTAAVNAYNQPLMSRYLSRLSGELARHGLEHELLVMQGNAGTMTARGASVQAAQTVMSGPAAGALAAARIGAAAGMRNIIGCDMGGTSFDVTLIREGKPAISAEKDIAYGVRSVCR